MNLLNNTDQLALVDAAALDPYVLALNTQEAATAFITAGTAANTVRSYCSALAYWSAWLQLRYGLPLGDAPLPATVAVQFVLDHLARPLADGTWTQLLPPSIDAALVTARTKAKLGPLTFNTVSHRLAVLPLLSFGTGCLGSVIKGNSLLRWLLAPSTLRSSKGICVPGFSAREEAHFLKLKKWYFRPGNKP
jgi:hypothetical protein